MAARDRAFPGHGQRLDSEPSAVAVAKKAGAGIVADSDPDDENLECHNKAAALLAAVPTARRMTAARKTGRR